FSKCEIARCCKCGISNNPFSGRLTFIPTTHLTGSYNVVNATFSCPTFVGNDRSGDVQPLCSIKSTDINSTGITGSCLYLPEFVTAKHIMHRYIDVLQRMACRECGGVSYSNCTGS